MYVNKAQHFTQAINLLKRKLAIQLYVYLTKHYIDQQLCTFHHKYTESLISQITENIWNMIYHIMVKNA